MSWANRLRPFGDDLAGEPNLLVISPDFDCQHQIGSLNPLERSRGNDRLNHAFEIEVIENALVIFGLTGAMTGMAWRQHKASRSAAAPASPTA